MYGCGPHDHTSNMDKPHFDDHVLRDCSDFGFSITNLDLEGKVPIIKDFHLANDSGFPKTCYKAWIPCGKGFIQGENL